MGFLFLILAQHSVLPDKVKNQVSCRSKFDIPTRDWERHGGSRPGHGLAQRVPGMRTRARGLCGYINARTSRVKRVNNPDIFLLFLLPLSLILYRHHARRRQDSSICRGGRNGRNR